MFNSPQASKSLRLISATRESASRFESQTLLGQSLQHPSHHSLKRSIAFENKRGLSEVYNAAIHQDSEEILVFCHDDLALPPSALEPALHRALEQFDIVGLVGNSRDTHHFTWHTRPDGLGWDYPYLRGETLSGDPQHPDKIVRGLTDTPVALIDGAFIAIKTQRLIEAGVRFDERFRFHFYDLDLCRSAINKGLRLGVVKLNCVHQSGGNFGDASWQEQAKIFCNKWQQPNTDIAITTFTHQAAPQPTDEHLNLPVVFNQGRQAYRQRDWRKAKYFFEQATQLAPNHTWSWVQLANSQRHLSDISGAIQTLERLCKQAPRSIEGSQNLAILLIQQNRDHEARQWLERLVALEPTNVNNIILLSDLLIRVGAHTDAESLLRATTHGFGQQQQASALWLKLGLFFDRIGNPHRAIKALHNGALLDPQNVEIQLPRVGLLLAIGQPEAALAAVNELLKTNPRHVDGLHRKAEILQFAGEVEESLAICRVAREIDPERIDLRLLEQYAAQALCDWRDRDQQLGDIEEALERRPAPTPEQPGGQAIPPFGLLTLPIKSELVQRETDRWVLSQSTTIPAKRASSAFPAVHNGNGRLRIGYLSADFRVHAMGLLLEGLFEAHDPERAETIAYSISPINDELTNHYRKSADHFHDLSCMSNAKALQQLENDELDALIDLSGLTTFSRPELLSAHPAQLQLSYLGFPGSQGHYLVDGILADAVLIPEELEHHYCEQVWRLPNAWSTRYRMPLPGITRCSLGLPDTGTLFCCLNRADKISPSIFQTWLEILQAVPQSWLWLAVKPQALKRLREQAQQSGLDPKRLVIAPYQRPVERFIAAMACADLFLDTPEFNAGAIGALALNAGLPLLTLAGQRFTARMGASLCTSAGLGELVMTDLDSYREQAIELGCDPERLHDLHQKLRNAAETLPLFQQQHWVNQLCTMLNR